MQNWA